MNSKDTATGIAAIIIAAGESRRLKGKVKQLLPWNNQPLISYIIDIVHSSGLSPIIIVLGANYSQIIPVIRSKPVKLIINPKWEEGKGSSISIGVNALPKEINAVMLFVIDQPFLSKELIGAIMREYARKEKVEIIAPYIGEIQSNPVLFTKKVFPSLLGLEKEEGGKKIISEFSVKKLQWKDEKILRDIDTLEDYKAVLSSL